MALDNDIRGAVRAPELRGTMWLNTPEPLSLQRLRGSVVLLDFFTTGCINCLHVLDDLDYLERTYAGRPFVVIGVHSPKFAHEADPASLRESVARLGVAHPILLDSDMRTWDHYAVRAWPTLVLIDPRGYIAAQVAGEGHRDDLDAAVSRLLAERDDGGPAGAVPPLPLLAGGPAQSDLTPLRYPGKVLADAGLDALFIADTGHQRLVWATRGGTPRETIGSGEAGARDGDFAKASFRAPQGMALDAERGWLYVADTGNHLIRRVDLAARTVVTIAGTGGLGHLREGVGPARDVPLNSPWDLCLLNQVLYIAMAGLHQVWRYDPREGTVEVAAGSGVEGRADGPARLGAFAQPSGLATDGERLFVADSESSCVRAVIFGAGEPEVVTLAGGDLFLFGHVDGLGDEARFQHPLGVTCAPPTASGGAALYIADTYNNAVRRLDPATRALSTLAAGDGVALADPGGISYAAGSLLVADTNHHRIRVIDLASGAASTLVLRGLCAPGLCFPV